MLFFKLLWVLTKVNNKVFGLMKFCEGKIGGFYYFNA